MIKVESEFTHISDNESVAFNGETPYETLVENVTSQFNEFHEMGRVASDNTNYLDVMHNAIDITTQIKNSDFLEFELNEDTVVRMKEGFEQLVLNLFEQIGIDLYQVENPYQLAYLLYTNFMLCDQRQSFFNYLLDVRLQLSGMESDFSVAYGWMMEDRPEMLYGICRDMIESDKIWNQVGSYLNNTGYSDMMSWIDDGTMPEKVMYDTFLNCSMSFDVLFVTYYQLQKATISY